MKKISVLKKSFLTPHKRLTPQQISRQRKEAIITAHATREKTIIKDSASYFSFQFTKK